MGRPSVFFIGVVLASFVAGSCVGFFIHKPVVITCEREKAVPSAPSDTSLGDNHISLANEQLQSQIVQLEKALAEQKKLAQETILRDRLDFLNKHDGSIGFQSFDDQLKISSDMADYLQMTGQEIESVERHLAEIQKEVLGVVDGKMSCVKKTDSEVVYEIPPFPNDGKPIKAKLTQLIDSDLGQERAAAFLKNSKWNMTRGYSNFGEQKTKLEVKWAKSKENGQLQYTIKQSFSGSSTGDTSFETTGTVLSLPPIFSSLIKIEDHP